MKKNILKNKDEKYSFLAILFLFCGFAFYTIVSFHDLTFENIEAMKSSVLDFSAIETGNLIVSSPSEPVSKKIICNPFCYEPVSLEHMFFAFEDIEAGHRFGEAIERFYDEGIIKGYGDGTFKSENPLNRAELLMVITTAKDSDFAGRVFDNCFNDVSSQWFSAPVCFAKAENWIEGFSDGNFRPAQYVSRSEAVKMVLEAFDIELPEHFLSLQFGDVSSDDWFAPYVAASADNYFISSGPMFFPLKNITRGEFVQFMYNVMVFKGLL